MEVGGTRTNRKCATPENICHSQTRHFRACVHTGKAAHTHAQKISVHLLAQQLSVHIFTQQVLRAHVRTTSYPCTCLRKQHFVVHVFAHKLSSYVFAQKKIRVLIHTAKFSMHIRAQRASAHLFAQAKILREFIRCDTDAGIEDLLHTARH